MADSYGTCPHEAYGDGRLKGASVALRTFFGTVVSMANDIGLFDADIDALARYLHLGASDADKAPELAGYLAELRTRQIIDVYEVPTARGCRTVGEIIGYHEIPGHPDRVNYPSQRTQSSLPYRDGSFFPGGRSKKEKVPPDASPAQASRKHRASDAQVSRKSQASTAQVSRKASQQAAQVDASDRASDAQVSRKEGSRSGRRGASPTAVSDDVPGGDGSLTDSLVDSRASGTAQERASAGQDRERAKRSEASLASLAHEPEHEVQPETASPPFGAGGATAGSGQARPGWPTKPPPGSPDEEFRAYSQAVNARLEAEAQAARVRAAPPKPDLRVLAGGRVDVPSEDQTDDPTATPPLLSPEEEEAEFQRALVIEAEKKRAARAALDGDGGLS